MQMFKINQQAAEIKQRPRDHSSAHANYSSYFINTTKKLANDHGNDYDHES